MKRKQTKGTEGEQTQPKKQFRLWCWKHREFWPSKMKVWIISAPIASSEITTYTHHVITLSKIKKTNLASVSCFKNPRFFRRWLSSRKLFCHVICGHWWTHQAQKSAKKKKYSTLQKRSKRKKKNTAKSRKLLNKRLKSEICKPSLKWSPNTGSSTTEFHNTECTDKKHRIRQEEVWNWRSALQTVQT